MKTNLYPKTCLLAMMLSASTAMPVQAAPEPAAPTRLEQQDDKIKGNVSDADGGLIGASVKIKGTNVGTMTDMDGNFTIDAKKGDVLVISYIGYTTQEITVTGAPIRVLLADDEIALSEVVVTATVLWEGAPVTIDWNADLCKLTAEEMAAVPVGATIYITYDIPEAEYHAMRITTPWWGDNAEDNLVSQFDLTDETPNPFEFVYDQHCKALVDERGAMCLVGFGYRVSMIAYK